MVSRLLISLLALFSANAWALISMQQMQGCTTFVEDPTFATLRAEYDRLGDSSANEARRIALEDRMASMDDNSVDLAPAVETCSRYQDVGSYVLAGDDRAEIPGCVQKLNAFVQANANNANCRPLRFVATLRDNLMVGEGFFGCLTRLNTRDEQTRTQTALVADTLQAAWAEETWCGGLPAIADNMRVFADLQANLEEQLRFNGMSAGIGRLSGTLGDVAGDTVRSLTSTAVELGSLIPLRNYNFMGAHVAACGIATAQQVDNNRCLSEMLQVVPSQRETRFTAQQAADQINAFFQRAAALWNQVPKEWVRVSGPDARTGISNFRLESFPLRNPQVLAQIEQLENEMRASPTARHLFASDLAADFKLPWEETSRTASSIDVPAPPHVRPAVMPPARFQRAIQNSYDSIVGAISQVRSSMRFQQQSNLFTTPERASIEQDLREQTGRLLEINPTAVRLFFRNANTREQRIAAANEACRTVAAWELKKERDVRASRDTGMAALAIAGAQLLAGGGIAFGASTIGRGALTAINMRALLMVRAVVSANARGAIARSALGQVARRGGLEIARRGGQAGGIAVRAVASQSTGTIAGITGATSTVLISDHGMRLEETVELLEAELTVRGTSDNPAMLHNREILAAHMQQLEATMTEMHFAQGLEAAFLIPLFIGRYRALSNMGRSSNMSERAFLELVGQQNRATRQIVRDVSSLRGLSRSERSLLMERIARAGLDQGRMADPSVLTRVAEYIRTHRLDQNAIRRLLTQNIETVIRS